MSIRVVREPANAKADIVLVHGLLGDQAPWTSEAGLFWPEKLLAAKAGDGCILSFEYDATISSFFDEDAEINDISGDLINEVMDHRLEKDKEERALIFVAHGLGGTVVENALVRAAQHPKKRELIGYVQGILLLGTPHFQDSSLSAATKYFQFANIPDSEIPAGSDLKEKAHQLISIPPAFSALKQDGAEFEIEGFYAGVKTKAGGKDVKIVDEDLARCPEAPPPEKLARNQLRLSQYDADDDKDFKKVVRVIVQWMSKIVIPEEEKGAQNVSNATFSGSHNSGLQLGQNAGQLKGFSFRNG
ncbi:hypothetical protein P170DRAFT_400484 [Aspergillus steynii IBT 23096]|uniref:Uncharacterized protein n=1 Tax=Aspergillus steynii IBT 23096 TaxID=1392250 RepID=A0A2I2GFA5_9EURO|nr:uncharacterized protein P170DRAFT_400484 [Aspergillus steynii IBT 23096]PLB51559.1 hypothetical protein P170DRAFT_400484 [Aspergillus steynii IBT 23096]